MHKAIVKLKSMSPYGQSKFIDAEKPQKESAQDFETRTWHMRAHTNEAGEMFIPPMQFKKCLEEAAKYVSVKIPGKKNATYTKHFVAGVMVREPLSTGVKVKDIKGLELMVPSDGKPGGGSRVKKFFPVIPAWSGEVEFIILDDTISEDVFHDTLVEAGKFIGIGFFRPIRGGYYGRFVVEKVTWSKYEL